MKSHWFCSHSLVGLGAPNGCGVRQLQADPWQALAAESSASAVRFVAAPTGRSNTGVLILPQKRLGHLGQDVAQRSCPYQFCPYDLTHDTD